MERKYDGRGARQRAHKAAGLRDAEVLAAENLLVSNSAFVRAARNEV